MSDFDLIYKILRILQNTMDCKERDLNSLSAESLGVSVPRWSRIMTLLINEGYRAWEWLLERGRQPKGDGAICRAKLPGYFGI